MSAAGPGHDLIAAPPVAELGNDPGIVAAGGEHIGDLGIGVGEVLVKRNAAVNHHGCAFLEADALNRQRQE
jgi:hypothetical protein